MLCLSDNSADGLGYALNGFVRDADAQRFQRRDEPRPANRAGLHEIDYSNTGFLARLQKAP